MFYFLKYFICIILVIFFSNLTFADARFVQVTGRAVIEDDSLSLAKIKAIEDALYLAALKGGAMISGYSSIDTASNLSEEVVIRPSSGILDYNIIDEIVSDQHYEVTINALIGNDDIRNDCQSRPRIRIIVYKPKLNIHPSSPAWTYNLPSILFNSLIENLSYPQNIELVNATNTSLTKNLKQFNSRNFNYAALTGSGYSIEPADFALEAQIFINNIKEEHKTLFSGPREEDFLNVLLSVKILDPITGEVYFQKDANSKTFNGSTNSLLKSINILTKPERKHIIKELHKVVINFEKDIIEFLSCMRLHSFANPSNVKNAIEISLGSSQGIRIGNLAMADSMKTPFAVFKVIETDHNSSVLKPLDQSRDVKAFYGKKITFMEFSNEVN